jgi:hydrogenase nickel incorporation protein HypA/HybF
VTANQAALVRDVRVRVGDLAGVVPESLEFCFSAAVAGTPWRHAVLAIERVPARARCEACGHVCATALPGAGCAACGDARVRMVSGQELEVASVDVADESDAAGQVGAAAREAVAS